MTPPEKKSINKKDLSNRLAERANLSKTRATDYINLITELISEALIEGKKVTISDFGTFNLSEREAFEGYDPKNKKRIQVPRRVIPVFRAGKLLKNSLNSPLIRTCEVTSNQLEVFFNKDMNSNDNLTNPKNYHLSLTSGTACTIKNIKYVGDDKKVILQLSNAIDAGFSLRINSPLEDTEGNVNIEELVWESN